MAAKNAPKKQKYEDAEQMKERHMAAIDAARATAGNRPPRQMLEIERAAVEASGGVEPLPLKGDE